MAVIDRQPLELNFMNDLCIGDLTDEHLKSKLTQIINSADRDLLERVYEVLTEEGFVNRLKTVLSSNCTASKLQDSIAKTVITIPAPVSQKVEFVNQFNDGFIDSKELLNPYSCIDNWFTGNLFARQVFMETATEVKCQGVGAGEFAFAAFSPEIKGIGQAGGGGDLVIAGKRVELKTKVSSWGRLHDAKKMNYDMPAIKSLFSRLGVNQPSLTVVEWIKIRATIPLTQRTAICRTIVESLFTHVATGSMDRLVDSLAMEDIDVIKSEWGLLSFANYKLASNFDGVLFFDLPKGLTYYVTDLAKSNYRTEAPQIYGPEMSAMPKIGILPPKSEK